MSADQRKSTDSSGSGSDDDDDCYGPALPPHLANKSADDSPGPEPQSQKTSSVIGPQLPAHIKRTDLEILAAVAAQRDRPDEKRTATAADSRPREGNRNRNSEADNPEGDDDGDDDDGYIGPYLPDDPRNQMIPKARIAAPKEAAPTKREEWMLICPQNRSLAVGMGPRQFLARTPDDLVFDKDEEGEEDGDNFLESARAELANKSEQERDQKMEGLMSATGGDKKESLLSIHRKRKMLEDAKSSEPKERKPFDRDTDLKVGGLSSEDKAKFIKRSEELTSRFKGGKKKFL